jgi:hypothetical protein
MCVTVLCCPCAAVVLSLMLCSDAPWLQDSHFWRHRDHGALWTRRVQVRQEFHQSVLDRVLSACSLLALLQQHQRQHCLSKSRLPSVPPRPDDAQRMC